jgi:hypothetical protein
MAEPTKILEGIRGHPLKYALVFTPLMGKSSWTEKVGWRLQQKPKIMSEVLLMFR